MKPGSEHAGATMSRVFGTVGTVLLVGAVLWWGLFFGALATDLGIPATEMYGETVECLFNSSDECKAVAAVAEEADSDWPAYQPVILWVAAACIVLGILMPRGRRR